MENQEIKQSDSNDEISLIDLLLVLLKFRKMIIGITVTVFCIVIVGYFVYPALQYRLQENKETPTSGLQAVMAVGLVPGADSFLSKNQFGFYFRRPDVIITALEESGVLLSPENRRDWILPLSGIYDNAKKSIYASPNEKLQIKEDLGAGVIEIYYKTHDSAQGILFLNNLFILGNEAAETHISSLGKAYIDSFELSFQEPGVSRFEDILARENQDKFFFIRGITSGSIETFAMLVEPYIETKPLENTTNYKSNYKTMAIVLVLAAFFLSIFFAFLRNTIAGIRENREVMEKIRGAFRKVDKERQ
jgi:TRAP-type C4-dicarboxylate transport system permease small subunit